MVYVVNLCDYGDRGDYEVFYDRGLNLILTDKAPLLVNKGFCVEYEDPDVVIFKKEDAEFTLYADGRLIIESLRPRDPEKAVALAASIVGFNEND